jgi:nitronate monooxygenase
MTFPAQWQSRLKIPAVAAPMFLVSNPALVIACCKAGIVGTFPSLNQRTVEGFAQWLDEITQALLQTPDAAPYGVNLIVHKTNARVESDLALCVKYKVPLVITSLGAVADVVDAVHGYGGLVFHDVISARHAEKAAAAGVDGIIAVSAGAGGHAGTVNPFALVQEIRQCFDGTILLGGCINHGHQIAAAQLMGADLAYIGTRFINTLESGAPQGHKQMIIDSTAGDILHTAMVSGVAANFMRRSLVESGYDVGDSRQQGDIDFGKKLTPSSENKAWKDVWSAGHGVGTITDIPGTAELVERLYQEYASAKSRFCQR